MVGFLLLCWFLILFTDDHSPRRKFSVDLGGLHKGEDRGRKKVGDEMPEDLIAKLVLSKEEIAHLYLE